MALTSYTIYDAARSLHTFVSQIISGKETAGHWLRPVPEGGLSVYRNLDLEQTGQVVKASAGQLYGGIAFNHASAYPAGYLTRYLKIYNKATAATSSDTPVITIPLESGVATPLDFTAYGVAFAAGISVRATIGIADNDAVDPGTNEVVVNLFYA